MQEQLLEAMVLALRPKWMVLIKKFRRSGM